MTGGATPETDRDLFHQVALRHAGQGGHIDAAGGAPKNALPDQPAQTRGKSLRRPLREHPAQVRDRKYVSPARVPLLEGLHCFDGFHVRIAINFTYKRYLYRITVDFEKAEMLCQP